MSDAVVEKLLVIFQNVNEWLKFAEAKNAVLIAFAGAGMTATLTVLATGQGVPRSIQIGLLLSTIALGISSLICAVSFLPKTDLEKLLWFKSRPSSQLVPPSTMDNLYFYGSLRKYNSSELLDAFNLHYFENKVPKPYGKECLDLANQIIVNSDIAFSKFNFFKKGVYSLIAAILVIPTSVLLHLIFVRGL
jgi:hypothetical protein